MVKKFSWRLLRTTKAALAGLALLVGFPITNGSAQKVAVLGYLTNANADPKRIEDVRHALANLGYVEGKNIAIEVKGAKSNSDYAPLAAELVARPVDIIIGVNAAATSAARNATRTIPIVMTAVNDPVEWGFINSLERPGTNVTGTTLNAPHLLGERLRILKGLVPALDRISMLVNGSNAANGPQFSLLNAEAKALNIEALALDVRLPQDIAPAFDKALAFGAKAFGSKTFDAKTFDAKAFDAKAFAAMPEEIRLRLLKRAIDRFGHEGPAELGKVEALLAALDRAVAENSGGRRPSLSRSRLKQTLGGALVSLIDGRICVEPAPPRRGRAD